MESENLIIDQDIIMVSYEVVRRWFNDGENQLSFTHGEGFEEGGKISTAVKS